MKQLRVESILYQLEKDGPILNGVIINEGDGPIINMAGFVVSQQVWDWKRTLDLVITLEKEN